METKKKSFDTEYNKMQLEIDETSKGILEKIVGYTQCDLIAHFNDFIDGCYLTLLIEVLDNGNKGKIKLRKSSVKVDLSQHLSEEDEIETETEGSSWMSTHMFISDIWRFYKFEPFQEKYDRLTKSVDFSPADLLREFLFKHVVIRNCIQHHDWQLDAFSLKTLGKTKIEIATDKEPIEIKEWKMIKLTKEEIHLLISNLTSFVSEFNKHVDKRVKTRHYRPKGGDGSYIVTKKAST